MAKQPASQLEIAQDSKRTLPPDSFLAILAQTGLEKYGAGIRECKVDCDITYIVRYACNTSLGSRACHVTLSPPIIYS